VIFVERPVLWRVLLALIVVAAVVCLSVGTFVGMLWATSHPERAPDG
jgi:ABC-type proline/glycine betaine transport system permease subunit